MDRLEAMPIVLTVVEKGSLTVNDIRDYHMASGLPMGRAKELLSAMTPDIRERVLLAVKQKGNRRLLVDPIARQRPMPFCLGDAEEDLV